ncbi:DNA-binding protein [Nocardioides acrostichi]|uniref:DNA-binding protein n=1 Tax=Nocardioides acrostichi TaxID=2784339 RepID=A0A930UYT2_9ACTN|nr:DNA-binding protein [Nocardioides acrostichi]MBF4162596.1 DNA-binding protein [Nocardioides acrostichi]
MPTPTSTTTPLHPSTSTDLMPAKALADRWDTTVKVLANRRSAGQGPPYVKVHSRIFYRFGDVLAYEQAGYVEPLAAR